MGYGQSVNGLRTLLHLLGLIVRWDSDVGPLVGPLQVILQALVASFASPSNDTRANKIHPGKGFLVGLPHSKVGYCWGLLW